MTATINTTYRISEVCQLLGISRARFHQLAQKHGWKVVSRGFYLAADVDYYITVVRPGTIKHRGVK